MNSSVRKRVWTALAVVACMALVGVVVSGAALAKGHEAEVVCKKIGKRKVSCPKKELHGKRGKKGAPGAPGAPGPAGPAGPAGANGGGIPLIFRGALPVQSTPIFNTAGLLIDGACIDTGPAEELTTVMTGVSGSPGSILRAADVVNNVMEGSNSTTFNQHFNLIPGAQQSIYELSYLASNGSSIITANYGIATGGLSLVNVSCAIYGTVQIAAG